MTTHFKDVSEVFVQYAHAADGEDRSIFKGPERVTISDAGYVVIEMKPVTGQDQDGSRLDAVPTHIIPLANIVHMRVDELIRF